MTEIIYLSTVETDRSEQSNGFWRSRVRFEFVEVSWLSTYTLNLCDYGSVADICNELFPHTQPFSFRVSSSGS